MLESVLSLGVRNSPVSGELTGWGWRWGWGNQVSSSQRRRTSNSVWWSGHRPDQVHVDLFCELMQETFLCLYILICKVGILIAPAIWGSRIKYN